MGVHGLWDLLAPVGRRVSVEALSGKTLAIDASIWMIQFMKAMRDDKGEMVRNAHLLGFFRRICKLLYLKTKPVFVFDGGTPALKRRTVIARRRQREDAQAKVRKMAEKLLLNQLKAIKLKELKMDLENQRKTNVREKEIKSDKRESNLIPRSQSYETMGNLGHEASSSTVVASIDNSEEKVDKVESKNDNKDKGKSILIDSLKNANVFSKKSDDLGNVLSQIEIDAMLAASLAADESKEATSTSYNLSNDKSDENESDEEELVLPVHGKVDPSILASLPPSVQLDLLGQMRERLMAENRQRYQAVKKAPEKFSELQIESYLKTVAFRKEIDEVQKKAAGRVADGVQTSRIASEANREFIFSSSFSGDKRFIAPSAAPSCPDQNISSKELNSSADHFVQKGKRNLNQRRFVRANRMKAMGIRMTRDLQRNLDMMKEYEMENLQKVAEASSDGNGSMKDSGNANEPEPYNDYSVEISFDAEEDKGSCSEDELFNRLVSDRKNDEILKVSSSESDWEEGTVNEHRIENLTNVSENRVNDGSDVEWEEGGYDSPKTSSIPQIIPSKGDFEEEDDLRKAIKQSLEDFKMNNDKCEICNEGDEEDDDTCFSNASIENSTKTKISSAEMVTEENQSSDVFVENSYESSIWEDLLPRNNADFNNAIKIGCEDGKVSHAPSEINSEDFMKGLNNVEEEEECEASFIAQRFRAEDIEGKNKNAKNEPSFSIQHIEDALDNRNMTITSETQLLTPNAEVDVPSCLKNNVPSSSSKAKSIESSPLLSTGELEHSTLLRKEVTPTKTNSNFKADGSENAPDKHSVQETEHNFDYEEELRNVEEEYKAIGEEQRKLERNADSVSSEMFAECQELLQMFGLPYIIAPMEAEAQCAYMEISGAVDGVVTDDSDVFLFGGRNVYKNIFDDRKYVETYFMKDVEKELGLSREKLIRMALLLGSDYTEGVSGVGIVNAIEIVNAFDEENGLIQFREWIESPDPNILGVKPRSKKNSSANDTSTIRQIFMDKHRNVSKNWHMPPTFPSDVVVSAYTCANVDKSAKPYSWAKPGLLELQRLCREKFGWDNGKSKEVLQPVLAEYEKKEIQMRMEAFYSFNERFAKIRSKRIMKAVKGMAKNNGDGDSKEERSKKKKNGSGTDESVGGGFCAEENGQKSPINDPISQLLPMPSLKRKRK